MLLTHKSLKYYSSFKVFFSVFFILYHFYWSIFSFTDFFFSSLFCSQAHSVSNSPVSSFYSSFFSSSFSFFIIMFSVLNFIFGSSLYILFVLLKPSFFPHLFQNDLQLLVWTFLQELLCQAILISVILSLTYLECIFLCK